MLMKLLPMALNLANWFIMRSQLKAIRKQVWIDMLGLVASDLHISLNLNKLDIEQHDDLQEQWDEKQEIEKPKEDIGVAIRQRQNPGRKFKRDKYGNIVPDKKGFQKNENQIVREYNMNYPWIDIAKAEIGQKEIKGSKHNPRIVEYGTAVDLIVSDDETPWCSSVMNWIFMKAGIQRTGKANARSWLSWGIALDKPRHGCVAILKRGTKSWMGHVGFYMGEKDQFILLLAGNQGNEFKYAYFEKSDVLGYRWPENYS